MQQEITAAPTNSVQFLFQPLGYALHAYTRYVRRALQLLRNEGPSALLAKTRRRLGSTSLRVCSRPLVLPQRIGDLRPSFRLDHAPNVSVIIPVHDAWRLTLRCLLALDRHTRTPSYEVIVVDDGSTDATPQMLAECHGVRIITMPSNGGFIHACNAGASVAKGDILVFLNNDTEVQPGWLDPILETFQQHGGAGIVGSRLLFPSGRQQEAGGLLFNDGSAWNYGHLDDPEKPEYSYTRQVDYVSGAALSILKRLFQSLGGFDTYFAPAYYEDADLAMRARAQGFEVWYQHQSWVVHREGATAGVDETRLDSVKRFQDLNRSKFVERWGHKLASFGPREQDLRRQKDRWATHHVLVVDVYMIRPDRDSGSLRFWNLFSVFRSLNAKVSFAALNLEAPEPYTSRLQAAGVEVLARPYIRSIHRYLKARGALYDLVILGRADTASALMPCVRAYCPNARLIFDTVDLHYLREYRFAALTNNKTAYQVAEERKRQELAAIAQADTTLVVSTAEHALLAREAPAADVRVLSNIHQVAGCRRGFHQRQGLLFIGAFAHPPNTDAVMWFCTEIFPLILQRMPDMTLDIVGAEPPAKVQRLASQNIRVHGHLRDIEPLFDTCKVSIAPLRFGAGVKGKINQSLAYGLPVVATSLATEGMPLVDEDSVLIANTPIEFNRRICGVYSNKALWSKLSKQGLEVIEKHYSFGLARSVLANLLNTTSQFPNK